MRAVAVAFVSLGLYRHFRQLPHKSIKTLRSEEWLEMDVAQSAVTKGVCVAIHVVYICVYSFSCIYCLFFLFIEFMGVTLVNKIIQISGIQFYSPSSVFCTVCLLP